MKYLGNTPILKGKKLKDIFVSPMKLNGRFITLLYKQSEYRAIGITAKKNIYSNKPQKNYIKRLLREAYKKTENQFPDKYSYFIICNKSPENYTFKQLVKDFEKIGKKVYENNK